MMLPEQGIKPEQSTERVKLNELVSLVAKDEEGGFEFHIIDDFDSTKNQIVHCFLDPQPHDSVATPTGTYNAVIITPQSTPQRLLGFQTIIMEALVSYFFDNQKTYNVRDKGLIHSFFKCYPSFDVTKNQLIILWKQIGSIGKIKDDYEKGLMVQLEIFHDYKEHIKENESKQKKIKASIKQYHKEQAFIEEIRTNPKAHDIINQCGQLLQLKNEIKEQEKRKSNVIMKYEDITQEIASLKSKVNSLSNDPLVNHPKETLTVKNKKKQIKLQHELQSLPTYRKTIKRLQHSLTQYNNMIQKIEIGISKLHIKQVQLLGKISKRNTLISSLSTIPNKNTEKIKQATKKVDHIMRLITTHTDEYTRKKQELIVLDSHINQFTIKVKQYFNNKKRVEDSINGRNKQIQLKQNKMKNITTTYHTIKNPTIDQTNKYQKKIEKLQGYINSLHEEINSLTTKKNMILEHITQTKKHLTSIRDQKTQLIVSYLSPSDQCDYALCSENIVILNKQIKILNKDKVGKSKSKKREIDTKIKTLEDQIAQQAGIIHDLENSYCKIEEHTLDQLVEQKNTTWKLIQSLRVQQEKAACDLNDLLQHIASIDSQSTGGEILYDKLSKKQEEHDILIKIHKTLIYDTKSLINSYVEILIGYDESIHNRMQSAYEYYQQGQGTGHDMEYEHSRHMKTLAFKWSQSHQFIQELKDSINKSGLMFLSKGSGHNHDITTLYTSIDNLLSWTKNDQSLLSQYGKELGKLTVTQRLQPGAWEYMSNERGGKEHYSENQHQTMEYIEKEIDRLSQEEMRINTLLKVIQSNILSLHDSGKIQVPKTNARIQELQKELHTILGWKKQYTKKHDALGNIVPHATIPQLHLSTQGILDQEHIIKDLEYRIRLLETKKAMIDHFGRIIKQK